MKFQKLVKAEDNDKFNAYIRYAYQQLEDIKNGIAHAEMSGNMTINTIQKISHHLSNARLLINYFIDK